MLSGRRPPEYTDADYVGLERYRTIVHESHHRDLSGRDGARPAVIVEVTSARDDLGAWTTRGAIAGARSAVASVGAELVVEGADRRVAIR